MAVRYAKADARVLERTVHVTEELPDFRLERSIAGDLFSVNHQSKVDVGDLGSKWVVPGVPADLWSMNTPLPPTPQGPQWPRLTAT